MGAPETTAPAPGLFLPLNLWIRRMQVRYLITNQRIEITNGDGARPVARVVVDRRREPPVAGIQ